MPNQIFVFAHLSFRNLVGEISASPKIVFKLIARTPSRKSRTDSRSFKKFFQMRCPTPDGEPSGSEMKDG